MQADLMRGAVVDPKLEGSAAHIETEPFQENGCRKVRWPKRSV